MVTRQELYDRIKASSKDEVILEEMIRLGFWPAQGSVAGDPADEIRRRGELERLLVSLTTEKARLQNPEAIKKAWREQRMAESKRKRQENKDRAEEQPGLVGGQKVEVHRAAPRVRLDADGPARLGHGVDQPLHAGAGVSQPA